MKIAEITWETLTRPEVLGTLMMFFMQFIGKGFIELMLCLVLRLVFKMTNAEVEAWPGRSPIYFSAMLLLGFALLSLRGIEVGPALLTSMVAMFLASGEYEMVKSGFRAAGSKIVPLGYKWH